MTMELELAFNPKICYALYHNKMYVLLTASFINDMEPRDNVSFKIISEPRFFDDISHKMDLIAPGTSMDIHDLLSPQLRLDPAYISEITESTISKVTLSAEDSEGNILCSVSEDVTILPFDHWPGIGMPETISSFITPNAQSLSIVRSKASDILGEWGSQKSLEGYQFEDRDRVLTQAAAIYAALERENITYVNPPAGFEKTGQRIRLSDDVLSNHEGTCLDLAILYASALESIGLNTVIFIVRGHAFAGFWLVDDFNTDIISWDSAAFTRMIRNKDFRAVECTCFTNTSVVPFDSACQMALAKLEDMDNFICAIDVKKSRNAILPLPVRKEVDGKWVIERSEGIQGTVAPESLGMVYTAVDTKPITKVDKWKRELLDITNKNNMINMKQGTKVIPLLVKDIAHFEDKLADGAEYTIYSKPQEWEGSSLYSEKPFESENYIGNYEKAFSEEIDRNKLRTPMTDLEMERSLRSIYRLANKEMDESGCNCLFVSLGVLRWYEGRSTGVPHYAPLILLPVEIKKKQKSFSIKKLDEETVFNVTLSEKLRQEFEIDLPNMDPLPMDESGVNVDQILQVVRQCIKDKEGWDVLQGASLGVFSFSQFAMWKDLDNNIEMFKDNPVIQSFVDGVPYPSEKDIGADANPYGLCLTVSADSSQIKAVRAAGEGKTFVMHGPPGTGKSQTITNMISNALYQNKTVLFVAEKRAALEVVQKRLEEVGIGNHCLELHSNKTEKTKVIDQLRSSLARCPPLDESQAEELMNNLDNVRKKLDAYVFELHKEREFGLSAYDSISRFELHDIPDAIDLRVDYSNNADLSENNMVNIEEVIRNADQAFKMVSGVETDTFNHIHRSTIVASVVNDTEDLIRNIREKANCFDKNLNDLINLGLPIDVTDGEERTAYFNSILSLDDEIITDPKLESLPGDLTDLCDSLMSLINIMRTFVNLGVNVRIEDISNTLTLIFNTESKLSKAISEGRISDSNPLIGMMKECRRYCTTFINLEQDMNQISKLWKPSIYNFNMNYNVAQQYAAVENAGFFSKGKARKTFMNDVSQFLFNPAIKFEDLQVSVAIINRIGPQLMGIISIPAQYIDNHLITTEISNLRDKVDSAEKALTLVRRYNVDPSNLSREHSSAIKAKNHVEMLNKSEEDWSHTYSKFSEYLELDYDISQTADCLNFCDKLESQIMYLFDWTNWNNYAKKLTSYGLSSVIPEIQNRVNTDVLVHSTMRSIYKTFINICRQESETLRMFSSTTFENFVEKFKKLDQTYTTLNRNILKHKLSMNVPTNMDESVSGTEANTLYRAINSSKIRKSIRKLLSEIPNMLPKLCPCLLMSPQSVSQYITRDYPKFDLVIFDESSQITTSKAIGALGRGKNAVIAGDSKQLPPTSFFQKKIEVSEEDDDMTDIDSFLDDCLSLNMPETYLEWHYRSRHESLIAFSNKMFYDNKMLTFPSPNDQETKVGLRHVSGVYERGKRNNQIEAKAVVDEIYRRVMDPKLSQQSIGVIAFSISQQTCIQDMLDDLVKRDSDFFEHLNSMPEEMFVKNLETVQGDERDVILFSIGYGPDINGNIYQNFGPINRDGGQRRLNVAISRARMEMLIFTSMNYTDVRLSSTSSKGVKSMREFLRFAENHGRFQDSSTNAVNTEGAQILMDIAKTLKDEGYDSHFNVGTSQFKIDIGIIDPDNPSEYILGILSDGESYRSSENTRDREYAREDVLRRLDWNLMHVWSVDWYFNKQKVLDNILMNLKKCKEEHQSTETQEFDVDPDFGLKNEPICNIGHGDHHNADCIMNRRDYTPPNIQQFDIDPDYAVSNIEVVKTIAHPIIVAESPIEENYLVKLYCKSVNIKRLSEQKRTKLIPNLRKIFTPDIDGNFITYWQQESDKNIESYRVSDDPDINRSIDCIPYIEICNAIKDTIRNNGSLQLDNATLAVARTLGFNRTGTKINEIINTVIKSEISSGGIRDSNGRLIL